MASSTSDAGTIEALLKRFTEYRLPRMQRMLERVTDGGLLSDDDIALLKRIQDDNQANEPLVQRNPEYRELVNKAQGLYAEIIRRGLENQENTSP
jgi:hypothetical protein